jgi:hypothetical protein
MSGSGRALGDPHLVVLGEGPLAGKRYAVHAGSQLVGRGREAQVNLESTDRAAAGLSRRHAWLRWDGAIASIADAGSRNGTAVNGRLLDAARELHDHDVIQLGALTLRFELPGGREEPTATHHYGVSNAVQGVVYGDLHQAGRDIHNQSWNDFQLDVPDPMDELFQGRGLGRLLMALGLLVALAGFGGWMYLILHSGEVNDPSFDPFQDKILGLSAPMVAFGAFAVGAVISSIGMGMSRAARNRRRDLERRRAQTQRRLR